MIDIFLPGDELPYRISMALALEARPTRAEREASYWSMCCASNKRNYHRWKCSSDEPCRYCMYLKELCD